MSNENKDLIKALEHDSARKKFSLEHESARRMMTDSVQHISMLAQAQQQVLSQNQTNTNQSSSSLPPRSTRHKK